VASRDLADLTSETREKAQYVIRYCADHGVELLVYCTARSLQEQARLFRQSRTLPQITRYIRDLRERGYHVFADIVEEVGPQRGDWATNAGPGESWHNYLEAFDSVVVVAGKLLWKVYYNDHHDNPQVRPAWQTYGKAVEAAGMRWLGRTTMDFGHAQLRSQGNPLTIYEPDEAVAVLKNRGMM